MSKWALVEVSDGLRLSSDIEDEAVLISLHLTDMFDIIHDILIDCLKLWVGLRLLLSR